MATTLDYLRLMRIPNVFTAVADVLAGFLLVRGAVDRDSTGMLLLLLAASALIYSAGMVLNDVFDVEIDRQERPERPLPSGRIALGSARLLGAALLLSGVLLAAAAPRFAQEAPASPWGPGLVALVLAACVLGYDAWLKHTPLGPLAMGACRGLNLLLGMAAIAPQPNDAFLGLVPAYYVLPLGSAIYITGLTWFARQEAGSSRRGELLSALLVMLLGMALIGSFPLWAPQLVRVHPRTIWYLLIAALMVSVARPFAAAVQQPEPQRVQAAVKHGIFSLVTIDASIALAGAAHPVWAVLVVALMAPARLLGRWVYST